MTSSMRAIVGPISASTFSVGTPRGRVTGGASLPDGKYPNPQTTNVRPRCFQFGAVPSGFPASATRSNPFTVPV